MKMADLFFREGTGFEVEGGQVPINGKCCQLHLIMNRLGFSMRKFCLSERAAHFFKAALALFVLGPNIVPGGGHAVEFKSLQKGHELSLFMHTLLLTCSARRHSVHNERWAAASGKAAVELPQPPGQDWFAAGRGCSGGRRRYGSFFDGQFAGGCNGFKARSLGSRARHEFYVWRS